MADQVIGLVFYCLADGSGEGSLCADEADVTIPELL